MRMRKSDFKGLKPVYRFTLFQMLKNRANLISAIILILFAVAVFPLSGLIGSAAQGLESEATEIERVYVDNQTVFALDLAALPTQGQAFSKTAFSGYDAQTLGDKEVVATLSDAGQAGYQITLTCSEATEVADWELGALYDLLSQALLLSRIAQSGATPEQLGIAGANVTVSTMDTEEYLGGGFDESVFLSRYGVQLAYAMVVLMLCTMTAGYIIRSVIDEKASRLVELLLTAVSPLSLIVGKVLAVMTYVFGMLLASVLCGFASAKITAAMTGQSPLSSLLSTMDVSLDGVRFTVVSVLVIFVSLMLAYLTICAVAALSGSACSRSEEADGAMTLSMLIVLGGYVLALVMTSIESPVVSVIATLLPGVNLFTVPVLYLLGSISIWWVLLSFVLQSVTLWGIFLLCAKVYRELLLYNGTRMKWKKILSLARTKGGKSA